MEFSDVLASRHSTRAYAKKDVSPEKLKRILEAVRSAPSAGNLQAYKVYAVRSEEARAGLAAAAVYQEFIAEAPIALVFCADKKQSESKYGERGFELYAIQDATIAAAYAQLAAADQGLGSAWVGAFDPLEVSRLVRAEPFEVPIAIIPLGYPAEEPEPRERRPLEELVKEV